MQPMIAVTPLLFSHVVIAVTPLDFNYQPATAGSFFSTEANEFFLADRIAIPRRNRWGRGGRQPPDHCLI